MVADINPINSGLWYSWGPHKPTFTSRFGGHILYHIVSCLLCQQCDCGVYKAMKFQERAKCRVMAMAMSYNWLFYWDEKHSINWLLLVLITGITRVITVARFQAITATITREI